MSDNGDSDTGDNSDLKALKLVITIVVLVVAFIVSIVVAKLVDMCYDRRSIRDDASDISENTRKLIRARLSVIQFKKRDRRKPEVDPEKKLKHSAILDFIRNWLQRVRDRRKAQEVTIKSVTPPGGEVVITVDKEGTGTSTNCNNNPVSPSTRLPVFSENKIPSQNSIFATRPFSAKQAQPPSPFAGSKNRNSVMALERTTPPMSAKSINDKNRPVSSLPRDSPNVTRVDVDNNAKVHVKSVHFQDSLSSKPGTPASKTKPEVKKPEADKDKTLDTQVISIANVSS